MVGVQDQQQVQRPHDLGVDLVGLGGEPERHPQEVLHQGQRVVRVEERLADRLLVGVGGDGRQLGQQPDRRQLDLLLVQRVHRVRVVRGERVDRAGQHRHRVRVAGEAVEEPLEVLVQQGVPLDLGGELLQLVGRRQLAVDQQVADLDERRLLGQLLDRVAAVAQDARVAVDVGDRALGRRGVDEPAVERGVAGLGQQRPQRDAVGSLRRLHDLQVDLAPRIPERGDLVGTGVFGHVNPFYGCRPERSCPSLVEGSRYRFRRACGGLTVARPWSLVHGDQVRRNSSNCGATAGRTARAARVGSLPGVPSPAKELANITVHVSATMPHGRVARRARPSAGPSRRCVDLAPSTSAGAGTPRSRSDVGVVDDLDQHRHPLEARRLIPSSSGPNTSQVRPQQRLVLGDVGRLSAPAPRRCSRPCRRSSR